MSTAQQTTSRLRELKLSAMAETFERQREQPKLHELSFDDRLALLVESEWVERDTRKLKRLLRLAGLPESAALEDLDYRSARGLDKAQIASLSTCNWARKQQNVAILGPTGVGKTWLACAFATQACRLRLQVLFYRACDLFSEIGIAAHDGSLPKLKLQLAKPSLLVLDDFGIGEMSTQVAHVMLEIVDRRMRTGSLLVTSQYPTDKWHDFFPDPTIADAVLDRVVHQAHRITLKGESMRKLRAKRAMDGDAPA
jgi:DNA replication protein DnaC